MMTAKSNSVISVGKKKSALARAHFKKGNGIVRINTIPVDFWGSEYERSLIQDTLFLLPDIVKSLNIDITVSGGGVVSQAAAARVAVARGLVEYSKDDNIRKLLIAHDDKILSGDSRQREPCKPNRSSPRAKRQKSYR